MLTVLGGADPALPAGLCVTARADGLDVITSEHCAAVVWRRSLMPSFLDWLAALSPEHLPRGRMVLRPSAVVPAVAALCDQAGMPHCEGRGLLISDIVGLAQQFASLMSCDFVRLRLDVVTTNACRRFHVDAVSARLVCTYRGTGTQYGTGQAGADPDLIGTVPTGAPILLRGTLWPAAAELAFLHRSPPIEGTGQTRLVLVLDPVDGSDI